MRYIKYLNEESAKKFLLYKTLKYTPLNSFNDPFEGNLIFCGNEKLETPFNINIDLNNHSQIFEKYKLNYDSLTNETSYQDDESLFEELCSINGVACLCLSSSETGIPDNMLMWAHYSRDHKGIAITFDPNHPYFDNIDPVHYSEDKLILDHKILLDHKDSFPLNTFFPKDKCWEYENEVRLSKWQKDLDKKETENGEVFLDIVPLDAIKEIFIGCQADKTTSEEVYKFCTDNSIEYIHFKKAFTSYRLLSDFSKQKTNHLSAKETLDLYVKHATI